jgi:hypothetical protein
MHASTFLTRKTSARFILPPSTENIDRTSRRDGHSFFGAFFNSKSFHKSM